MKRVFIILSALLLLSACGKTETKQETAPIEQVEEKETGPTLKEAPSGFVKGYEKAEFSKFNSYASENGLGDTPIWVEGTYEDVLEVDASGNVYYNTVFTDLDGNNWLVLLDGKGYCEKESYEALEKHQVVLKGLYQGYSGVYEMPAINLGSMFDRETGNILASKALTQLGLNTPKESIDSSKTVDEDSIEQKEEETERTGIRPEFKEMMDKYESFYDEYIDFMNNYDSNDPGQLLKYASLLSKVQEYDETIDQLSEEDMSAEEALYFSEVNLRVAAKLETLQ